MRKPPGSSASLAAISNLCTRGKEQKAAMAAHLPHLLVGVCPNSTCICTCTPTFVGRSWSSLFGSFFTAIPASTLVLLLFVIGIKHLLHSHEEIASLMQGELKRMKEIEQGDAE